MSFGKFDILYPEIERFKNLLNSKDRLEPPVSSQNLFSEVSDEFVDGDMTVGEYELAQRFPLEYDLRVNGIKHIYVNDLSQGIRYIWVDGKLVNVDEGVF